VHAGCKCGLPSLTPSGTAEQTLCGTGRIAFSFQVPPCRLRRLLRGAAAVIRGGYGGEGGRSVLGCLGYWLGYSAKG
jgi:hypothetical protein